MQAAVAECAIALPVFETQADVKGHVCKFLGDGAQGRDRTADTAIFSRMLYQLSYLGMIRRMRTPRL